jgi:phosphorylcholine metabolism protein LicD
MINPFETIEARLSNIENLLLDLKHSNKGINQLETDRWFNLKELCAYLPDKPKHSTIYGYVHLKSIPFHKKGKPLIFLKSEIDLWLRAGRKKTLSEIETEAHTYIKKKGGKAK